MLPLYRITANLREHPINIVGPDNFATEEAGEISEQQLLEDPSISLYCLDPEKEEAHFIRCRTPEKLENAAFYYQTQAELAEELIKVPFSSFHQLAAKAQGRMPKAPLFIHNVGRCGSTLVSKVLGAVPSVHSLSEPDDLTQMLFWREPNGSKDEWLKQLIASSIAWRCKPGLKPNTKFVAIKPRSEVASMADLYAQIFPTAKHVFLSRELEPWLKSVFTNWLADTNMDDKEKNAEIAYWWGRIIPLVKEVADSGVPLNPAQTRALGWASHMRAGSVLAAAGVPYLHVTYEELMADPREFFTRFFDFCCIEDADWTAIESVLGEDSQQGTIYDREVRRANRFVLSSEQIEQARELVRSIEEG